VILNGGNATLSARLLEDDGPAVVGRTVNFTLGAQACNGVTNASGVASCGVPVSSALGPQTVTSNFAGDAFYLPSSDSDSVIVFAFPSKGAFVIGDTSAGAAGTKVWWGSKWATVNALSGGAAPSAFKGFAENPTLPVTSPPATCSVPWTSSPGNSGAPPSTVPAYMGVIVSGSVSKTGSSISSTSTRIVVVQPDAGYGPSPGKPGTGTIVAVYCP
jgi:hypothetical protein